MALHQDLSFSMDGGQDVTTVVGHDQLDDLGQDPQTVADGLQEVVDPLAGQRREDDRTRVAAGQAVGVGGHVGLVERQQLGNLIGADLGEHGTDGVDLGLGSDG